MGSRRGSAFSGRSALDTVSPWHVGSGLLEWSGWFGASSAEGDGTAVVVSWVAASVFRGRRGSLFWVFRLCALLWALPWVLDSLLRRRTSGDSPDPYPVKGESLRPAKVQWFLLFVGTASGLWRFLRWRGRG